jgi:hypothetical protein
MAIKGTVNPSQGVVSKVIVRPSNRTTIASPNFEPKINLQFSDLIDANTSTKTDGAVVVYDATNSEYTIKKLDASALDITLIDGGKF